MKLSDALELLTYSHEQNTILMTHREKEALKLGIEALKWIRDTRCLFHSSAISPLPGETED